MTSLRARRRDVRAKSKGSAQSAEAVDYVALDGFRRLFDIRETPIADFMESFEVDTDEEREDESVYAPFALRPKQREALAYIETSWDRWKRAARIMNLKGRRYGMTTFYMLLALERILRVPGYNVVLVAQDDVMARVHFGRVRAFLAQIPRWALTQLGITVLKDTDQEIVLRHGAFKRSCFRVAPAKRNALGRGDRVNMLILTEFPQWPRSAKADLTGILRACNRARGNLVVFESTARGYEEFHDRCKRAWEGKSDYHFFFVPSYEHPAARKSFASPEAEREFEASVGVDPAFGGEEELQLFRRLMTQEKWPVTRALEHLHHRRSVLMSEYGGHIPFYHREEPTTPDEAFEGTGEPVFDLGRVNGWMPYAKEQEEKAERGRFRRVLENGKEKVAFVPDRRGNWFVFSRPEPGTAYCFGSDTASGVQRHADGRTEADFSTDTVDRVDTGRTVARFKAHIKPSLLAEELLLAAVWYGEGARGNVEVNMDGGTTVDRLEEAECAGVAGYDIMLQRRVIERSESGKKESRALGFRTTSKSKHTLVRAIDDFLAEAGSPSPDVPPPFDFLTLQEMLRFKKTDKGGMEAAEGHDDLVMSKGLALLAREECQKDLPRQTKVKRPLTSDEVMLEFWRQCDRQNKTRVDPVLGGAF